MPIPIFKKGDRWLPDGNWMAMFVEYAVKMAWITCQIYLDSKISITRKMKSRSNWSYDNSHFTYLRHSENKKFPTICLSACSSKYNRFRLSSLFEWDGFSSRLLRLRYSSKLWYRISKYSIYQIHGFAWPLSCYDDSITSSRWAITAKQFSIPSGSSRSQVSLRVW